MSEAQTTTDPTSSRLQTIARIEEFLSELLADESLPSRLSNSAYAMLQKTETIRSYFRQKQLKERRSAQA